MRMYVCLFVCLCVCVYVWLFPMQHRPAIVNVLSSLLLDNANAESILRVEPDAKDLLLRHVISSLCSGNDSETLPVAAPCLLVRVCAQCSSLTTSPDMLVSRSESTYWLHGSLVSNRHWNLFLVF